MATRLLGYYAYEYVGFPLLRLLCNGATSSVLELKADERTLQNLTEIHPSMLCSGKSMFMTRADDDELMMSRSTTEISDRFSVSGNHKDNIMPSVQEYEE
ncbi:hypothetical protein [Oryza sativa Japonica Group]|uniref:Uncharacterized protein n=1 Tax=Oryza sativa subsp. japonica TaxID=39947 RepID=Q5JLC1_ORYSJ|nr:hypothetical protein [Oryza sativa Japonica Group]